MSILRISRQAHNRLFQQKRRKKTNQRQVERKEKGVHVLPLLCIVVYSWLFVWCAILVKCCNVLQSIPSSGHALVHNIIIFILFHLLLLRLLFASFFNIFFSPIWVRCCRFNFEIFVQNKVINYNNQMRLIPQTRLTTPIPKMAVLCCFFFHFTSLRCCDI